MKWETFEDFSLDSFDTDRWLGREQIAPDGSLWRYEEPSAWRSVSDGTFEMGVSRFEKAHDTEQRFDNAKMAYFSAQRFELPANGILGVSATMAAEKFGGGADDFRDGVASLNVVDFESGLVLDFITTGERIGAVYERLPSNSPQGFTYVVDAPLHSPPTTPGSWQNLTITIDSGSQRARFIVGETLIYEVNGLPVMPTSVQVGLALMTLRPLSATGSTSIHGQGIVGRWRDIRVGTTTSNHDSL